MSQASQQTEEEKQTAQSSAHVSPAMRIYRHALESIFGMLDLQDLHRALSVSRSWSAAVTSMKPIAATFERNEYQFKVAGRPFPAFSSLVASPLLRHLAALELTTDVRLPSPLSSPLTNESLALLAQHAPNLTSLWCSFALTPSGPWILPAKLTALDFDFLDPIFAPNINALFVSVCALPALRRICVMLPDKSSAKRVDFSLLAEAPSLTDFKFEYLEGGVPTLSHKQCRQIRTSLGHLQRIDVMSGNSANLARFLQPPVTARWQTIGFVWIDAATEALLATLPSLTKFHGSYKEDRPHADFLSKLSVLTNLKLWSKRYDEEDYVPHAAMLNSLLHCTGITELELQCGFNSAQWSELFAKLPSLAKVSICEDLESLQCFASGPITQSLTYLRLYCLHLLPSELSHLSALCCLQSLQLDLCFPARLDDATLDSLSPPTSLLPTLTMLFHQWLKDDGQFDSVHRTGSSFEWMQKRLTQ